VIGFVGRGICVTPVADEDSVPGIGAHKVRLLLDTPGDFVRTRPIPGKELLV